MSWADDEWGKPFFPTRSGGATGHANERMMLDSVGGMDGIRTKIRTNDDGSTTLLKTRGGMPVFYTTPAPTVSLPTEVTHGIFLYYKLASDVHPWGLQKNVDATASAKWSWPTSPVSYSELKDTTDSLSVSSFASGDGPGTLTWEDTRDVKDTTAVLSWSPIFGNGRSAPVAYGSGLLNRVYYQMTNSTAYNLTHNYYFEGLLNTEKAGRYLPGQRTTGGYGGAVRFASSVSQGYLYEDGVKTGVYGFILAACKVVGVDETFRTISIVPKTSQYGDMIFQRKTYDAYGGTLSTAGVSISLTGYARSLTVIQPPRFNSIGTKAAGILRYVKTDTTNAVAVIEIDWVTGDLYAITPKGDEVQTISGVSPNMSGSYSEVTPLSVDYIGDTLTLLWQKTVSTVESANAHVEYSEARPSDISTDSLTATWTITKTLYLDSTAIRSAATSRTQVTNRTSTKHFVQDPVYAHIWYPEGFDSSGTSTATYNASESITNITADLRKKAVLFCVDASESYTVTTSQSVSTSGWHALGNAATYAQSGGTETTGSNRSLAVYLHMDGKTDKSVYSNGAAGMNSLADSTSWTYSGPGYNYTMPVFGWDVPFSAGAPFTSGALSNPGWLGTPNYATSQFVESLSLAADSSGKYLFVSGLFTHGISHVIAQGIDAPVSPSLSNFGTMAKLVMADTWVDVSLPIVEFPSTEGWPGKVWVSEPLFLKTKAIEP